MYRLLRPFIKVETYAALLYHVAGLVVGSLGLAVVFTGWGLSLGFAITPLIFPVLFGFRWAVGLLGRVQAEIANGLLGTRLEPPMRTTRGDSFWTRSLNTVRDEAFWRQQAHLLASWVVALIAVAVAWNALQLLTLPIWYRLVKDENTDVYGLTDVDTFAETLPLFGLGLVLTVVAVHLVGWTARLSRALANRLLTGEPGPRRSPTEVRARRFRALSILALLSTAVVLALIVIWAATTVAGGYFWPIWPLLSLALVVAIPGWVVAVLENDDIPRIALGSRALAIQAGVSVIVLGFLVGVWAVTTHGYFWPIWPALGLGLLTAVHAALVYGQRTHRLERSRAAAVDVQESELQRIERDLHDGAQARLVALGMSIGMAEEKLSTDPEGARVLLAEARSDARNALEELRDLARGIRPPLLTDRGLEAAIAALAARSPVPISLTVELPSRPPAAVETAAYFVVAEALANAIKHAEPERIDVRIRRADRSLVAEVEDDGKGGADPAGNGLEGLARRVRALEGTLRVTSPGGGPTTVTAELPCA